MERISGDASFLQEKKMVLISACCAYIIFCFFGEGGALGVAYQAGGRQGPVHVKQADCVLERTLLEGGVAGLCSGHGFCVLDLLEILQWRRRKDGRVSVRAVLRCSGDLGRGVKRGRGKAVES